MDLGTVMSVTQTLFAALQCSELKEMCSLFGYKSELENLKRTVSTVRAVLKDAEAKQELSHQAQLYIDELKDAVFDADDLLDEFVTLAEQQQLIEGGGRVSKKVRVFFSRFNSLNVARKMSKGVKKIRKDLDVIASNYGKFGFKVDYEPIKIRREETCGYVNAGDIIGRGKDLNEIFFLLQIMRMLQADNVNQNVCFLSIVGIGGLGKTALAQLIYNDSRVKSEFPLRMWACASDQDQMSLDLKSTLENILSSVTNGKYDGSTMHAVQTQLHQHLTTKRFLLVLDDLWTEDREQWLKLEKFLKEGVRGSWVVVTTRSEVTGRVVGDGTMYKLQGLSSANSWRLFEMTAFHEQESPPSDLVEIGYKIVKKCANVPLAIRAVGSLLYGQSKSKWLSFQAKGLAITDVSENGIRPILMLSYHNLEPRLKSCFAYCAIYPKDFVISKVELIRLWMAQSYIVPFGEGQSLEEAAEEYFLILLRRCFFQDVKRNKDGEVISCKIHDLMHDIAQNVAGKEIHKGYSSGADVSDRVRHMPIVAHSFIKRSPAKTQIRTCLQVGLEKGELPLTSLIANCMRLRTLNLSGLDLELLPESIGTLLHLRYLDLSQNYMETLPKSVTKLHNLQTLNVGKCSDLKELPTDLCNKLLKLRVLDIRESDEITYLPSGMGKLTSLHTLSRYIVGLPNSSVEACFDQLEDLKALCNLKGSLEIEIWVPANATYVKEDDRGGEYMKTKEHLVSIEIVFGGLESNTSSVEYEEKLLEEMQPHFNLEDLILKGWSGVKMPSWATKDKFLPNLVKLKLVDCEGVEYLPWLGRLRYLKELMLGNLSRLEYVENESLNRGYHSSGEVLELYPCLEVIQLEDLPKLKGWWRTSELAYDNPLNNVEKILIFNCPEMTSIPLCPSIEALMISDSSNLLINNDDNNNNNLQEEEGVIKGVPWRHLSHTLRKLHLRFLEQMEYLPEGIQYLTSLTSLYIYNCPKLLSLPDWIPELTSLRMLEIKECSSQLHGRYQRSTGEYWPFIQPINWLNTTDLTLIYFF